MKNRSMLKRILNVVLVFLLVVTVLALVGGLALGIYVAAVTEPEIDQSVFEVLSSNTASKIYY